MIRQKAAELLKNYESEAKTRELSPAFSEHAGSQAVLGEIARHCLGLSVFSDTMLPDQVLGCINGEEDTISISPSLMGDERKAQRNFVTAHEIGHAVLKHPARPFLEVVGVEGKKTAFYSWDGIEDIDEEPNSAALLSMDGSLRRYSTRANVELQANIFAAELLVPLGRLREWLQTRGHYDLTEMSVYFGVSKNTIKNQLMAAFCGAVLSETEDTRALPDLDTAQFRAATATGSTLVVAGPGAGKTRVLTARFVHLVNDKKISPEHILVLTYSHKAAEEMRTRLAVALPDVGHEINVGTFHALGQQLLLEYWREAGFAREPTLLTDADAFVLLRSRLGELPLVFYADILEPTRNLRVLLEAIGRLKDELIGPEELHRRVEAWTTTGPPKQKARELVAIYRCYQGWLRAECFVDYGDLVLESVRLFQDDNVAWDLHDRFRYILVDEFQDVNRASGLMLQQMDGGRAITWAVADPRQSIYAFRGASRENVEAFVSQFAESQVLELSTNYRSVGDIVHAGNAIQFTSRSPERDPLHPEMKSAAPYAQTPVVTSAIAPNVDSEIAGVVRSVQDLRATGYASPQIAILCRRREMAKNISMALEEEGISTDWCGAMHEQPAFKDMMAVLLLSCNHPHALPRLLRHPAHALCEADLKIVHDVLRAKGGSPRATLRAFVKGEVAGLSTEGLDVLQKLREISVRAARRPSAFNVLSAYLWEETSWFLARCQALDPLSQRYIATVGQIVDLSREFSARGTISSRARPKDFVDYVRSCLETGRLKTSHEAISIPDAIPITTTHGSKGLEWPVVLVPGCVEMSAPYNSIVYPPDLSAAFSSGNDHTSRACLAYVAVTRARERLILSHVEGEEAAPLEPAFAEVIASLKEQALLKSEVWSDVVAVSECNTNEEVVVQSTDTGHFELKIEVLEALQFCSQKAKYIHVDELRAESTGYLLFRRLLSQTFEWMISQHNNASAPDQSSIEAYLNQVWNEAEPHERQLGQFYRARSLDYAQIFAGRLMRSGELRWKMPFANKSVLPGISLQFKIDECERSTKGSVLRWHCFHSQVPRPEKLRAHLRLALYSRQRIQGIEPELRVYHVPTGRETRVRFNSEDWQQAKEEILRLHRLWHRQEWIPNPTYNCFSCPFNFLCPT